MLCAMGLLQVLNALRKGLLSVSSSIVPGLKRGPSQPAPPRSQAPSRINRKRVTMSAAAAGSSSPPKAPASKLEEQATAKADLSYSYWAKPDKPANSAEPPKKLTPEEAAALEAANARASSGASASAWNQAGTFEEKSVTEWAKQQLKTCLVGLSCGSVTTTAVNSIDGDAHVWFVRGKKRHGFDLNISIAWEASSSSSSVKGNVKLPSASPDDLDDLHIEVELAGAQTAEASAQQAALREARGLKDVLEEVLQQFYQDMKAL